MCDIMCSALRLILEFKRSVCLPIILVFCLCHSSVMPDNSEKHPLFIFIPSGDMGPWALFNTYHQALQ